MRVALTLCVLAALACSVDAMLAQDTPPTRESQNKDAGIPCNDAAPSRVRLLQGDSLFRDRVWDVKKHGKAKFYRMLNEDCRKCVGFHRHVKLSVIEKMGRYQQRDMTQCVFNAKTYQCVPQPIAVKPEGVPSKYKKEDAAKYVGLAHPDKTLEQARVECSKKYPVNFEASEHQALGQLERHRRVNMMGGGGDTPTLRGRLKAHGLGVLGKSHDHLAGVIDREHLIENGPNGKGPTTLASLFFFLA